MKMEKGRKKREQTLELCTVNSERGVRAAETYLLLKRKDSCILRSDSSKNLDDTSELRFLNTWRKKSEKYYM